MAAGDGDALVTAPVSKEALRLAGYPWPGQTEMLADLCAARDLRVLLMAGPLRVVHVSAHRSLRDAIDAVTGASVLRTIELADDIGRRLLGRPPGSRWPGSTRTPESTASWARRTSGSSARPWRGPGPRASTRTGPLSADTLFPRAAAGQVDLVVAMYHDQGHIPVKLLGRDEGVAVTLGLPFLRMSPDHGAAFDIAGQGVARPGSMTAAIRAAVAAPWRSPVTAPPAGRAGCQAARDGYLLALDAGTGSCRAALFTAWTDGRPPWPSANGPIRPTPGIPGSQSFDTAGNWALICACIREVLAAVPGPAGGAGRRLLQHGRRAGALRPGRAGTVGMRQRRRPGRAGGGRHAGQRDRGRTVPAGRRLDLAERPAAAGLGTPPRAGGGRPRPGSA